MLPFQWFQWCETSTVALAIRNSEWLFPVIESLHLVALAVMGGTVLVVDLRLLNLGLVGYPLRDVARDAQRWFGWSLAVMLMSGALLFISEATKCYHNPAFWAKMITLSLATTFTFTVRRKVIVRKHVRPLWKRVAGVASLSMWTMVAVAGRAIGFY
jgi:hypothetical protein